MPIEEANPRDNANHANIYSANVYVCGAKVYNGQLRPSPTKEYSYCRIYGFIRGGFPVGPQYWNSEWDCSALECGQHDEEPFYWQALPVAVVVEGLWPTTDEFRWFGGNQLTQVFGVTNPGEEGNYVGWTPFVTKLIRIPSGVGCTVKVRMGPPPNSPVHTCCVDYAGLTVGTPSGMPYFPYDNFPAADSIYYDANNDYMPDWNPKNHVIKSGNITSDNGFPLNMPIPPALQDPVDGKIKQIYMGQDNAVYPIDKVFPRNLYPSSRTPPGPGHNSTRNWTSTNDGQLRLVMVQSDVVHPEETEHRDVNPSGPCLCYFPRTPGDAFAEASKRCRKLTDAAAGIRTKFVWTDADTSKCGACRGARRCHTEYACLEYMPTWPRANPPHVNLPPWVGEVPNYPMKKLWGGRFQGKCCSDSSPGTPGMQGCPGAGTRHGDVDGVTDLDELNSDWSRFMRDRKLLTSARKARPGRRKPRR